MRNEAIPRMASAAGIPVTAVPGALDASNAQQRLARGGVIVSQTGIVHLTEEASFAYKATPWAADDSLKDIVCHPDSTQVEAAHTSSRGFGRRLRQSMQPQLTQPLIKLAEK